MGAALVTGLIRTGWVAPAELVVVEQYEGRRAELAAEHSGLQLAASVEEASSIGPLESVVVAVKPTDVREVCEDLVGLAGGVRPKRVLSLAAGVTLASLEGWLGKDTAVVRAMPNTPALVGSGASAISPGRAALGDDVNWARSILEAVGTVVELPESSLDAVTGLSGSGPAYVFLIAEALIDAGVLVGLTRPVARELAVKTLLGSARLLADTGEEASALRAAVTSPGGTTAAGLRALEAAGVRNAILDAVVAATERSRELGAEQR